MSKCRAAGGNDRTHVRTWQDFLSAKHADLLKEEDVELVQNKSPKVDAKTLAPASFPTDPDLEWCAASAGRVAHRAHACLGPKRGACMLSHRWLPS